MHVLLVNADTTIFLQVLKSQQAAECTRTRTRYYLSTRRALFAPRKTLLHFPPSRSLSCRVAHCPVLSCIVNAYASSASSLVALCPRGSEDPTLRQTRLVSLRASAIRDLLIV